MRLPKKIAIAGLALLGSFQIANAQELGPTLQKIKDAGAIAIGYRETAIPMSYADQQAQPVGFALDLCALVANKVKQTLGLAEIKTVYKPAAPGSGALPVQDGTVDLDCSAVPISQEEQRVAFSIPIFESELRWIVPKRLRVEREGRRRTRMETISPSTLEDLKGKTVVLSEDSALTSLVLTLSNDRSLGLSIVMGKDSAEAFKLFETGKAAAFLAGDMQLAAFKAGAKNPDAFGFLSEAYPGASYALVFRKDDKPFKDLVDGVLTEAMRSGDYARLYAKWFESPIPPRNVNLDYPMPQKLRELLKLPAERPQTQ